MLRIISYYKNQITKGSLPLKKYIWARKVVSISLLK